jgi:outer membrane protein assembly factor BamB
MQQETTGQHTYMIPNFPVRVTYTTDGTIGSSAIVSNGTVYVGSWDGYEYALDESTGALKWKTFLGITTAPTCFPPVAGVTSSATVDNGVVYLGGGDSYLYALDAVTGAVLWRIFTGDNRAAGGHYNWSSPLIYNGYAYIGISSFGDCQLEQGQLWQVDLNTHQVVHTFDAVPSGQVGGGIWGSPAIDKRPILFTSSPVHVTINLKRSPRQWSFWMPRHLPSNHRGPFQQRKKWSIPTLVQRRRFSMTPPIIQ